MSRTQRVTKRVTTKVPGNADPLAVMAAQTREAVELALGHYGKPTMSLDSLRRTVATALPSISLADVVLKERASGW